MTYRYKKPVDKTKFHAAVDAIRRERVRAVQDAYRQAHCSACGQKHRQQERA